VVPAREGRQREPPPGGYYAKITEREFQAIAQLGGGSSVFAVYLALKIHARGRTYLYGEGAPTAQRLATLIGIGRNTVLRALKALEAGGVLVRGRDNKSRRYDVRLPAASQNGDAATGIRLEAPEGGLPAAQGHPASNRTDAAPFTAPMGPKSVPGRAHIGSGAEARNEEIEIQEDRAPRPTPDQRAARAFLRRHLKKARQPAQPLSQEALRDRRAFLAIQRVEIEAEKLRIPPLQDGLPKSA
jgi:DNA-binding transcriptional MocR family regulator